MLATFRCPLRAVFTCAFTLFFSAAAYANHGPGASGGGTTTASGETLKQNHMELSIREDFTQFEEFTAAQAAQRAVQGGDFDALRRSYITSIDGAYGITNDFQISAAIGYVIGDDFISADHDAGTNTTNVSYAEPEGLTDLVITGKYRVYHGPAGMLALIAGIKAPTGRTDVHLSNGELLSPTDQPGTGSWDVPLGIAYSRFLTSKLTMDASIMYLIRTEHNGFQVGDRLDVGVALAYRLTENINTFPQYSVFGELAFVYLQLDREEGVVDPNSGSETLYLTPGFRIRFTRNVAFTIAPEIPIFQHVNGDQGKVDFKITAGFSFSF